METESRKCDDGGDEICLCPLEGVMEIISKRWAILIIGGIGNHKTLRYNEIMKLLGNISPKSLSDRLKELEKSGLIERKAFAEIPPRVEYTLTEDGEELRKALMPLMDWVNGRNMKIYNHRPGGTKKQVTR
jgi:DNA-binding HxlR family transcriptional regulator